MLKPGAAAAYHLLAIDVQNDFCDPAGALFVPGADGDADRLAQLVRGLGDRLGAVTVTLDTHLPVHIAHPVFWRDARGCSPEPFTMIAAAEVRAGRWTPRDARWRERATAYVDALEAGGRYALTIWPPHCLCGTGGHALAPGFAAAINDWQTERLTFARYVAKGASPFTEHYSAVRADVPDPADPTTAPDLALLERVRGEGPLLIAGQALSHCVANTVRDLAELLGDAEVARWTLLTDAASPVRGFEELGATFVADLRARGMRVAPTLDLLA